MIPKEILDTLKEHEERLDKLEIERATLMGILKTVAGIIAFVSFIIMAFTNFIGNSTNFHF